MPELNKRTLYQGSYRSTINDPDNSPEPTDPESTTSDQTSATQEDLNWRKRYSDLRSHSNSLTERVKELESQLVAAQKKEVRIPSTQEELVQFARQYPDVYRHIRSIAMAELLQNNESITQQTNAVKENLEKMERELGYKKILAAHPDFEAINASDDFQLWAAAQPQQIQDWLFAETNPDLCIKGLDLYKAETGIKKAKQPAKPKGADLQVNTRTPVEVPDADNKKIWKGSEIEKMHPKQYEKYEAEIELARLEGRIDVSA